MGQAEIARCIEANLKNLQINTVFRTKRKLFTELGIAKEADAKQIETVLKGYVRWEKTGRENKRRKETNEIRVINIIYDYHYIDGRSQNGGAHNNTYITQLKPLLLHFHYNNNIMTTKAIAEKIYGFQREIFDNYSQDSGLAFYTTKLENKIQEITEDALKSLKREELLDYQKVFMIVSAHSYTLPFGIPSKIDIIENPLSLLTYNDNQDTEIAINLNSQNIKGMLRNSRPWLDDLVFTTIAEEILQKTKRGFSFDTASIMDFLDIVVKYNININLLFKDDEPKEPEWRIAWEGESILINGVTSSIREHLNFSPIECRMNPKKKRELYRRTDIFWKLIGWEYTYNAYQITINNDSIDVYPQTGNEHADLRENLDKYMITEVNKTFVVDTRKNILYENDGEGKKTVKRRYWVAEKESVKERHCEIFWHLMDEQIFREDTYEIVNVD